MNEWFFCKQKIRKLTNVKISFGYGKRQDSLEILKNKSVLLVCSKRMEHFLRNDSKFKEFFRDSKFIEIIHVDKYPEIFEIEKVFTKLRNFDADFDMLLAIGGGSVIDTAKLIKVFFSDKSNTIKSLIGKKNIKKNSKNFIPLIAIPSTAGTGSEVTPYATVWDSQGNKKYSISEPFLIPEYAFIDPELLEKSPKNILITTGFDAINQAFDSIWNRSATTQTIELAISALSYGINTLPKIIENQFNDKDRYFMFLTSICSGVCIANTKTSICHSISYPLTSYFKIPHGLACVFTMNAVLKMIHKRKSEISEKTIENVDSIWLKNNNLSFLDSIDIFVKKMNVSSSVKNYITTFDDLIEIKNHMFTPERMENFILPIDSLNVEEILQESWN